VSNTGTSITLSIPSSFTSGTLSVTATNSCGATSSRSTTLTAVPATPASISGPASACPSQTGLVFTTPAVTGLTQSWAVPTGAVITAGQGTTSMTCTWGTTSGNVSVRNVNSCGQSTAFTKSVAIATCMEILNEETEVIEGINKIEVFPNPSSGVVTIRSNGSIDGVILNALGQEVQSFKLSENNNYSVRIQDLPAGLYFVKDSKTDEPPVRVIRL
ncbi:MAG: T9SS type A sorting domain-containing protein, partial [Flavobacteriales bacterium]